jgi:hypothetical protein
LTAAAGRKFGLTVGLAFTALGLLLLWRGRPLRATVLLSVGGLFVAAGLIAPTHLGPVERAWMKLAHLISKVTTPIFMAIVYFVVITPIGFLRRRMGSPLAAAPATGSRWQPHSPDDTSAERMEHQF